MWPAHLSWCLHCFPSLLVVGGEGSCSRVCQPACYDHFGPAGHVCVCILNSWWGECFLLFWSSLTHDIWGALVKKKKWLHLGPLVLKILFQAQRALFARTPNFVILSCLSSLFFYTLQNVFVLWIWVAACKQSKSAACHVRLWSKNKHHVQN